MFICLYLCSKITPKKSKNIYVDSYFGNKSKVNFYNIIGGNCINDT